MFVWPIHAYTVDDLPIRHVEVYILHRRLLGVEEQVVVALELSHPPLLQRLLVFRLGQPPALEEGGFQLGESYGRDLGLVKLGDIRPIGFSNLEDINS